jgi:polyisoprenoid-binding protein YceI
MISTYSRKSIMFKRCVSPSSNLAQSLGFAAVMALSISVAAPVMASEQAADWQVNLPASSLSFNTTKSGTAGVGGITETMRFKSFKGGVDSQGRIALDIALSSIDSGIGLRDERLQTMFWNVAAQPTARFSGQIKPDELQKIVAGKNPVSVMVQGQLTMAGQTKPVNAPLYVVPLPGKLIVSTRQAIVINANDFGLNAGAEALRAVMGLNYLSTSVPITFQLELNKAGTQAGAASGA